MGRWGESGNLSASQDTMGASQDAPQEFRAAEVSLSVWPRNLHCMAFCIATYNHRKLWKKHEKVSTWNWIIVASLVAQMVKNLPAVWETGFDPWVGKIPWRGKWQPTPVFLPGEPHGQRNLVGYIQSMGSQRVGCDWAAKHTCDSWGFLGGSVVKNLTASARDMGSIPGSRRSPGEGNGNPLQFSCLGNPMDRGAWRATVHEVAKSRMWFSH